MSLGQWTHGARAAHQSFFTPERRPSRHHLSDLWGHIPQSRYITRNYGALSACKEIIVMKNNRFSRREFLQTTAGAAGATFAANTILLNPQTLLGSPAPTAASDRVRFGIVGVGMEGSNLLTTAIQLAGVECAAACDLYDGRHELARELVGKPVPTT